MSQFYTTIIHPVRKDFKLSCNEYCVLDTIMRMQNNDTLWCYMSKETMGKDLDLSKQSVINIINSLIEKELVYKNPTTKHLRVTSVFMSYINDYKKFTDGKETLLERSKNFTETGKKTLPNNNTNNKNTFIRPTAEQINEYSKEIGFTLDGSQFIDHYEARGWLIGKNPMKDWKAAVRTWKRNSNQFTPTTQQTTKISLK
jgi:predicted transcriptional regulator